MLPRNPTLVRLTESQLCPAVLTVSGYDNNKKAALGKIIVQVTIGPLQMETELIVVNALI